jgi:uncharacterized protein (DUF2252 family)
LNNQQERDIWKLIQAFNAGRDRDILLKKYAKMRADSLTFFRGTCHLFYRDLPQDSTLNSAPLVWICGDLHLENFGTYKGENRQIYFGINDFDESLLAPCTWDITRLLTSILLTGDSLGFTRSDARKLARVYLTSYIQVLSDGKIRSIFADNAKGIVADLFDNLSRRKRSDLLDERTKLNQGFRRLKFDDEKVLKISNSTKQEVTKTIELWAESQINPGFFEVLDVGFRLAGTGSLGLDRYLILVAGNGSPDRNYLLDFKQQLDSSLQPYVQILHGRGSANEQPVWKNPATRVLNVQKLVQPSPPALLAAIEFNGSSYLLRELQPHQDKIGLKAGKISLSELEKLIETMADVTACAHLHGSAKYGAAIITDLIAFGHQLDWREDVLNYASDYAKQVQLDYQLFCQATQDL